MYSKYSEDELIDAYSTMMDFSGKPNKEIIEEIEMRGGLEKFQKTIETKQANKKESDRVLNEIIKLNGEGLSYEEIKQNITSDIWTQEHLNAFTESRYYRHQLYLNDKSIDGDLFWRSILGTIAGCIVGSIIWCFSIIYLKFIFYPILVGVYLVSYLLIRGITGKTHNNLMVFLSGVIATIVSFFVGFVILGKL